MATVKELKATARPKAGKGAARAVRREGLVPGVIYGDKKPPLTIALDHKDLRQKIYAGRFLTTLYDIEIDGAKHEATYAVVSRAKHYAGKWIIAPDAKMSADTFEVLIFPHRDHATLFRLFMEMQRGRGGHLEDGLARIVTGRDVSIRSLEGYEIEVQVDGDCVLKTPIRCRIRDEMINVLLPHEEAVAM